MIGKAFGLAFGLCMGVMGAFLVLLAAPLVIILLVEAFKFVFASSL